MKRFLLFCSLVVAIVLPMSAQEKTKDSEPKKTTDKTTEPKKGTDSKEPKKTDGEPAKGKQCKGMAGLIEEGDEVIEETGEQDDAAADLALIAAAQKVEHYEISAYGTARTMAGQIGLPAVATLLNKSLAEEEIADNLMTQIARELMSQSRTGMSKEPKRVRTAQSVDEK